LFFDEDTTLQGLYIAKTSLYRKDKTPNSPFEANDAGVEILKKQG